MDIRSYFLFPKFETHLDGNTINSCCWESQQCCHFAKVTMLTVLASDRRALCKQEAPTVGQMAVLSASFTSLLPENIKPNNVPLLNSDIKQWTYPTRPYPVQKVWTSESAGESSLLDEDASKGIRVIFSTNSPSISKGHAQHCTFSASLPIHYLLAHMYYSARYAFPLVSGGKFIGWSILTPFTF